MVQGNDLLEGNATSPRMSTGQMFSWKEMLLLLEGQLVHFPSPKNHYSKDVCLLRDTSVVETFKSRVVFERNGKSDEVENEMMETR